MSRALPDAADDSSAEALWRMYAKAKASLPYRERMQNLTWRMMGMNYIKNTAHHKENNNYVNNDSSQITSFAHSSDTFDLQAATEHPDSINYFPQSHDHSMFSPNDQQLPIHQHIGDDEYLNFGDSNSSVSRTEKPKVTSNLTKFFLGQQEQQQLQPTPLITAAKVHSSSNDPTSDDFDYVAHIKKIGQEDSHMERLEETDHTAFKSFGGNDGGSGGVPIHATPTDIPYSNSHNEQNQFNFNSVSSSFNNNQGNLNSENIRNSITNQGHRNGFENTFGSGYLDSPNHDGNSYMDPLDAISSSYETPSNFNNASSSFNDNPSYFQSVYSQSLHSPASSAAQTPSLDNGLFFDGYFNGVNGRNNMSFANRMRSVPSSTSFVNMQNAIDNSTLPVNSEDTTDVVMEDLSMVPNSSQSNLSSSFNSRRQSTASTIKKKSVSSKLTKAKRSSSSTQLATSAPVAPITTNAVATSKKPEIPTSNINTRCTNCNTQTTPLWRRNPEGQPLCNACGLFLKLHGVVRPLSLKTDVIKKRQRGGSTLSKSGSTQPSSPNKTTPIPTSSTANTTTAKKAQPSKPNDDKKKAGPPPPLVNSKRKNGSLVTVDDGSRNNLPDARFLDESAPEGSTVHNGDFEFNDRPNPAAFQFGNTMDVERSNSGNTTQSQQGESGPNNNWEWLTMAL